MHWGVFLTAERQKHPVFKKCSSGISQWDVLFQGVAVTEVQESLWPSLSYLLLAVFSTGLLNKSLCSLLFLVKALENNYLSQLHPCSLPGAVAELMEQAEVCRVSFWALVQSQVMLHLAGMAPSELAGEFCCLQNPGVKHSPLVCRSAGTQTLWVPSSYDIFILFLQYNYLCNITTHIN